MIDANYHTHTFRCGHAFGTEREYIENAISLGFKVLGFSDHVIIPSRSKEDETKFEDYIKTINSLKEEYKDKIEIHLGFECEYLKSRDSFYRDLLKNGTVEYLIIGQHYVSHKGNDNAWMGDRDSFKTKPDFVKEYYRHLKMALKTGLFSCIAHPDWIVKAYTSITPEYLNYCRKICKLAKRYKMPLEINLNGLKNHHNHPNEPTWYPNEDFFKIAGEVGNDIIVGIDAHEVEFWFKANYALADEFIKKYNLHQITRMEFKNPYNK